MFRSPQNLIRVDHEVLAVVACCDGLTVCGQLDVVFVCTPELVPSLVLNHDIIHITRTCAIAHQCCAQRRHVRGQCRISGWAALHGGTVVWSRVYWCSARYSFVDQTAYEERSLCRLSHR